MLEQSALSQTQKAADRRYRYEKAAVVADHQESDLEHRITSGFTFGREHFQPLFTELECMLATSTGDVRAGVWKRYVRLQGFFSHSFDDQEEGKPMLLKNEMVEIGFYGSDIAMVSISHRNKDNTTSSTVQGDHPSGQFRYSDLGSECRTWIDPILEGMRAEDAAKPDPDPETPAAWADNPAGWEKFKDELDGLGAQELEMAGLVRKGSGA